MQCNDINVGKLLESERCGQPANMEWLGTATDGRHQRGTTVMVMVAVANKSSHSTCGDGFSLYLFIAK